jgi:hypothetical protein
MVMDHDFYYSFHNSIQSILIVNQLKVVYYYDQYFIYTIFKFAKLTIIYQM